jgi:hypothetical protein
MGDDDYGDYQQPPGGYVGAGMGQPLYDFCFSPPKSVNSMWAGTGDERLVEAGKPQRHTDEHDSARVEAVRGGKSQEYTVTEYFSTICNLL